MAGAGALRSSAQDLLTYVEAYLHPDKLPASAAKTSRGKTLPAALRRSLNLNDEPKPGMWQALAWGYKAKDGNYFHDGGTGGFTSCVLFNPKGDYGVVVLMNVEAEYGTLAENLCWHISQRLEGKPALSLEQ
jgi:CubicO group peptidase (beta-lactamase class C family)